MFSENSSTTWRHFGYLMVYFIFVQFIQPPVFSISFSIAHALFFLPLYNLKLSSKHRHYHSSKFICTTIVRLVCPKFFQTQQIHQFLGMWKRLFFNRFRFHTYRFRFRYQKTTGYLSKFVIYYSQKVQP